MKKDRLYFLTFLSITFIFLIIALVGIKYFVIASVNQIITIQIEFSSREANQVAQLITQQVFKDVDDKTIEKNIQTVIEDTQNMTSFISVINWSGKQVCHPDITKVGEIVKSDQTLLDELNEEGSNNLYKTLFKNKQDVNPTKGSEIINMTPIDKTDYIVLANVNLVKMASHIQELEQRLYIIFLCMGGAIIILSFFAVRIIGSLYEKQLEFKNTALEGELINLSKLNADLLKHQQKITEVKINNGQKDLKSDLDKKRLLTYIKNELVPIKTEDISYIQTELGITYVYCINGKRSISNLSLDELFNILDLSLFFRANRQFIIGITAVDKILRYGNSQLKVLVKGANEDIIISKNRAAEFKQWLSI